MRSTSSDLFRRSAVTARTHLGERHGVIEELESLRGIAIALVVVYHAEGAINGLRAFAGPQITPWRAYVVGGFTGVSLFFVLSGFLLSRPFVAEVFGGGRVVRREFYARRILRIMPLYCVAIAIATLACAQRPGDLLRGLPFLVFLNSIEGMATPLPPFSYVWWSLATEAQFYVVLPVLASLLLSRRGRLLGGVVLAAYVMAYVAFACGAVRLATMPGQNRLVHSFLGRAPLFACGALAAVIFERRGAVLRGWANRTPWVRNGGADLLLLGALLALGMLLRTIVYVNYFELEGTRPAWHLVEGPLWTLVLLLLVLAPLRTKPLLSNRVFGMLGVLSYSIYLVHIPVLMFGLQAVRDRWPGAAAGWSVQSAAIFALLAGACVGLSVITYAAIERPFLDRKSRLGVRCASTSATPTTVPAEPTPRALSA